jgi:hypothetical protein
VDTVSEFNMRARSPKHCPRCDAIYEDLASGTCPRCFARLESISADDAAAAIAEQEERARDPEYQARKRAEDERFKEQSFGACAIVSAVTVAVVIASTVLLTQAARHGIERGTALATFVSGTALPANFERLVPAALAGAHRIRADADIALPGSVDRVYVGVYDNGARVYAVNEPGATPDQMASLEFAGALVAEQRSPPLVEQEIVTSAAYYVVLGPSRPVVNRIASGLSH